MAATAAGSDPRNGPLRIDQEEVWQELLPYLATGWKPAETSGNAAMCALYALTASLNAHRIQDEGLDPGREHPSYNEVEDMFTSSEYEDKVKVIAKEFSRTPANPEGDPLTEDHVFQEYMQVNWLNPEQIGVVLEMINEELDISYRFGVITAGQPATETRAAAPPTAYIYDKLAGTWPVIWLYSYGNNTHWEAIVPDRNLTPTPACDYNRWGFQKKALDLIDRGLYLVTGKVDEFDEELAESENCPRQMGLERGQFVWEADIPDDEDWTPPSEGWFWGQLPSLRVLEPGRLQREDVPLQQCMGPVHISSVSRISRMNKNGRGDGLSTPVDEPPLPTPGTTSARVSAPPPPVTPKSPAKVPAKARANTPAKSSPLASPNTPAPAPVKARASAPAKSLPLAQPKRPAPASAPAPAPSARRAKAGPAFSTRSKGLILPTLEPVPGRMGTPGSQSSPPLTRRTRRAGRKYRYKNGRRSRRPLTPSSSSSTSSEASTPRFPLTSNLDPLRRQPAYYDEPGTLRMYFNLVEQHPEELTSRKLHCDINQLLLKTDHEHLGFPRMREIDLLEGYVSVHNLERIRRPWGIQRFMPTRGVADLDSKQYGELKVYAEKKGIRPGNSTRSVKRNILRAQHEAEMEIAVDRQELDIARLRSNYLPTRDDYDPRLDNATRNCRYVLKIQDNVDGTWLVSNIDGYWGKVGRDALLDEPMHWGIAVPAGSELPHSPLLDSPEPMFVAEDSEDSVDEEKENGEVDDENFDDVVGDDVKGGDDIGDDFEGEDFVGEEPEADDGIDFGGAGGAFDLGDGDRFDSTVERGVDGVLGALIALRNAVHILDLEIRASPPGENRTEAIELAAILEGYIREANRWLTQLSSRARSDKRRPDAPTPPQNRITSFLKRLIAPATMVLLARLGCRVLSSLQAHAAALPSSSIAGVDLITMSDFSPQLNAILDTKPTLGNDDAPELGPSRSRKRSFDESELGDEPSATRFSTKRQQ